MDGSGIYDVFRAACAKRGTTLTTVLKKIGHSDGSIGNWKKGNYPRLDIAMKIADNLAITLDELCYGEGHSKAVVLTEDEKSWLAIANQIPPGKKQMCIDFLKTHATVPPKYADEKKELSHINISAG